MNEIRQQTIDTIVRDIKTDIYNEGVLKHRFTYEYNFDSAAEEEVVFNVMSKLRDSGLNVSKDTHYGYNENNVTLFISW